MNPSQLTSHVQHAIEKTMLGQSSLGPATLAVKGFSTPRMRALYNNLCATPDFTYLEVGLWHGASFTAACCDNTTLTAYGLDNFAQTFGSQDVRADLLQNLEAARLKTGKLTFTEEDCWTFDQTRIGQPVDFFLYDGDHSLQTQYRALPHFLNALADTFLFAVDDWNWGFVEKGTLASIRDLQSRVRVIRQWTWHTRCPQGAYDAEFHNGLALFALQKI